MAMTWSIQQVARVSGVTARTLRYYDEIGLLRPDSLGSNGYRYYERQQLSRLHQILLLRELGLDLGVRYGQSSTPSTTPSRRCAVIIADCWKNAADWTDSLKPSRPPSNISRTEPTCPPKIYTRVSSSAPSTSIVSYNAPSIPNWETSRIGRRPAQRRLPVLQRRGRSTRTSAARLAPSRRFPRRCDHVGRA